MQIAGRLVVAVALVSLASHAAAQKLTMPGEAYASDSSPGEEIALTPGGGSPLTDESYGVGQGQGGMVYASGSYFNPTLGSHIRARYNTRSYGQEDGMLDLGTMKLLGDPRSGGLGFFDGQVTLNEESNVGYNLGLGYRWLTLPLLPYGPDREKILGVSVWTDGQGVGADNFFTQVGTSLEFLGDRIDFRANGYAPVGPRTQNRDFRRTGDNTYTGNNIAELLIGVQDTALTVGEAELAGRIADLDAWVFGGVYGFRGGAYEEVGGKVGLRGYATPDLALSIALTNDDEFDTNAVFSLTWFIGRTRAGNCPCGTLRDRLREPVIRNDYIATQQSVVFGTGDTILDPDGEALRIVHVDGSAPAGGDGTFENPLNFLDDVAGNSQEGDIILAHADTTVGGQAALQNNQTFFGEGGGAELTVQTEDGDFILPETSSGARDGALPIVSGGVTVAFDNTVQNLAFDGGTNAIVSAATGSMNANLRDLTISNTTGNGIELTTVIGPDTTDLDNDSDTTETTNFLGDVVIDNVAFSGVAGNDIAIDGMRTASEASDNPRGETIAISNVTSTGNVTAPSIAISNTNNSTGDTTTITDFTYEGGTLGGGGVLFTNTGGGVSVQESDFTGGAGPAVEVVDNVGSVSIGSTVTIADVANEAVVVTNNTGGVTVDADITTDSSVNGGGVSVTSNQGVVNFGGGIQSNNFNTVVVTDAQAAVNFSGSIDSDGTGDAITITDTSDADLNDGEVTFSTTVDNPTMITNEQGLVVSINGGDDTITIAQEITDNGDGIFITGRDTDGLTQFTGQTTLNTTVNNAVSLVTNDATSTTSFNNLDITTTSGTGVFANDGGELNVTGTGNTIETDTGKAIDITGGSSTTGVAFSEITVTNGASEGIDIEDFDGTFTVGQSTLSTAGTAIALRDVENAVFTDTTINATGGPAIDIENTGAEASTIAFNTVTTPTGVTQALVAEQTGTGALGVSVTGGTFNGTTTDGILLTGLDGNSTFNDVEVRDGTGAGVTISGGDGTFAFDGDAEIANQTGDAFTVDGGESTVTYNGSIENSAGRTVAVQNKSAGGVTFGASSTVSDTGGTGVLVNNNTGGNYSFLGDNDLSTGANDAVTITNNTGADVTFSELDIDTTSGAGFTATGGGTVAVLGTDSTIDTTTGNGLTINDTSVSVTGVTFDSVTVNGAANGIDLRNTSGGTVTVGSAASSADGDGGTLDTTGVAVIAENVDGLVLNNVTINTSGATSIDIDSNNATDANITLNNVDTPMAVDIVHSGTGDLAFAFNTSTVGGSITAAHSGAGTFDFNSNALDVDSNVDIDATDGGAFDFFATNLDIDTGANVDALNIELSGSLDDVDISLSGSGTSLNTQNGAAMAITTAGTAKDVRFALTSATLANDGGSDAFTYVNDGASTVDATLSGNTFNNEALFTNAVGSNVNMSLTGNNSATGGGIVLTNNNAAANFAILGVDGPTVNAGNNNDVTYTGGDVNFTFNPALVVTPPSN